MTARCVVCFLAFVLPIVVQAAGEENYRQLVKQLASASYADRKVATQQLFAAGPDVFPFLVRACDSGNLELVRRAVDILKRHASGDDLYVKRAARESLQQISEGKNSTASQLAKRILDPPKEESGLLDRQALIRQRLQNIAKPNPFKPRVAKEPPLGGNLRRVQVGGVAPRQVVQIRIDTAERRLDVFESSDIIRVTVIKVKDGKAVDTKKFQAANAKELSNRHPEAAKAYAEAVEVRKNINVDHQAHAKRSLDRIDQQIQSLKERAKQHPQTAEHAQRMIDSMERLKLRMQQRVAATPN